MTAVFIRPVARSDAAELIQGNIANRAYHAPWTQPFADADGFETWFGQTVTGPNVGLVARENTGNGIVGVVNVTQIVWGAFRSACDHERWTLLADADAMGWPEA